MGKDGQLWLQELEGSHSLLSETGSRKAVRKAWCSTGLLLFPHCIQLRTSIHGINEVHIQAGSLPFSFKPLWKYLHRHMKTTRMSNHYTVQGGNVLNVTKKWSLRIILVAKHWFPFKQHQQKERSSFCTLAWSSVLLQILQVCAAQAGISSLWLPGWSWEAPAHLGSVWRTNVPLRLRSQSVDMQAPQMDTNQLETF